MAVSRVIGTAGRLQSQRCKMIDSNEKAILKRLRLLEMDHPPEGWSAIQMKYLTLLLNIIEREEAISLDRKTRIRQLQSDIREQRSFF